MSHPLSNLQAYISAYVRRHGVPPSLYLPAGRKNEVHITHHPSVSDDDCPVIADIEKDLPHWTANLGMQADLPSMVRRLAPVNIREVFAYELSALEGS